MYDVGEYMRESDSIFENRYRLAMKGKSAAIPGRGPARETSTNHCGYTPSHSSLLVQIRKLLVQAKHRREYVPLALNSFEHISTFEHQL